MYERRTVNRVLLLAATMIALLVSSLVPVLEFDNAASLNEMLTVKKEPTVHHSVGATHHQIAKLHAMVQFALLFSLYCLMSLSRIRIPRFRLAVFVPILLRQLLLRPLQFTSSYYIVRAV